MDMEHLRQIPRSEASWQTLKDGTFPSQLEQWHSGRERQPTAQLWRPLLGGEYQPAGIWHQYDVWGGY